MKEKAECFLLKEKWAAAVDKKIFVPWLREKTQLFCPNTFLKRKLFFLRQVCGKKKGGGRSAGPSFSSDGRESGGGDGRRRTLEGDSRAEEEEGGKVCLGGRRTIAQGRCRIMMAPPPTKVARGADIAEAGRRRQQKEEEGEEDGGQCPKYSPHSGTKGRKEAPERGGHGREMDGDGRVQKMPRPATTTTTTTANSNGMCKRKRGRPPRKKKREEAAAVPKGGGGELRAADAEGDTCKVTLPRRSSDARMMLQSPLCSSPGRRRLNAREEGSSRDQERTAAGEIKGRRSLCRRPDEKPAEEKGRRRFNGGGGGGGRRGGNKFVLNKKAVDVVDGGGEGGGGERGAVKKSSYRKEAIQDSAPAATTKTERRPGMVLPDEVIQFPALLPRRSAYGCVFAGPDSLFQEVEDQMLSEAMM